MQHHYRSDQIKLVKIVPDRPGIIHAFMQPTKLKNQVRIGQRTNDLRFVPHGKNLVGGAQWTIEPQQRPGLAQPLIQAKQEQKALAQGLAIEAKVQPKMAAKAKALAVKAKAQEAKSEAVSEAAEKDAGLDGYSNYFGAYGSYGY